MFLTCTAAQMLPAWCPHAAASALCDVGARGVFCKDRGAEFDGSGSIGRVQLGSSLALMGEHVTEVARPTAYSSSGGVRTICSSFH